MVKGGKNMRIANLIAWIILLIGGLNWLLIGAFSWNLVEAITGNITWIARVIYCLVGASAIWLFVTPILNGGKISMWNVG